MKRHDLNLEKYNITKNRYRELYYFCLQYDERKRRIDSLRLQSPPPPDGMPKGNQVSRPTENAAILAAKLSKENEIIEQAAIEASADLYPWILEAVKYDLKYDYLRMQKDMPCGKNEFRKIRHKFYFLLDKK